MLSDEAGDHGEQVCEGDRPGRLGRGVVDLRAAGCELGDVDPGAPSVAECACEPSGGLEDGLYGILGRSEDVAVGVCDLEAALVEAPVGKDPSSEEEFLLCDHPPEVLIAVTDPVQPFFEALALVAVLLGPDISTQLVVLA